MIDLHAHVLPGLDDGPKTLEQSLDVCRQAVSDGTSVIVAVAHANHPDFDPYPTSAYWEALASVQALLQQESVPLTLLPAMEIRLGPDVVEGYRRGDYLAIGESGYICIELPSVDFPLYTLDMLYQLSLEGLRILLIHPERNRALRKRPDLVDPLINMQIVGVASAGSLLGQFGEEARQAVWTFMDRGLIQSVSSDGHSVDKRPLLITPAWEKVQHRYGEDAVEEMRAMVPKMMMEGIAVPLDPWPPIKRKWWSRLAGIHL